MSWRVFPITRAELLLRWARMQSAEQTAGGIGLPYRSYGNRMTWMVRLSAGLEYDRVEPQQHLAPEETIGDYYGLAARVEACWYWCCCPSRATGAITADASMRLSFFADSNKLDDIIGTCCPGRLGHCFWLQVRLGMAVDFWFAGCWLGLTWKHDDLSSCPTVQWATETSWTHRVCRAEESDCILGVRRKQ